MDDTSSPKPRPIGAAQAQLLGWLALALVNQLLIIAALPKASAAKTSLLHHLYDFGQLLGLGVVSWIGVRAMRWAAARFRPGLLQPLWRQALLLALGVFVVGLATAADDVSNLAERLDLPQWLLTVGLSLAFALALGGTRFIRLLSSAGARAGVAAAGLALAVGNGLVLRADYFACHLMAAWFSALLLAQSLEGATPPRELRWQPHAVGAAALTAITAVAVPSPGEVRLRLYALPSSVLAPLIAGLLPDAADADNARVPARYRDSPWFKRRDRLPPVPPTRAIVAKDPPIVMFFTIDAFRADVLENEEHRSKLPGFTRLRKEASYFRVARSPTTSTMTTMASVFSGKYYSQLRWSGIKKEPLIEPTPRFPELLAKAGVRTLLYGGTLGQIYGESGVARGFAKETKISPRPSPAKDTVDAIIGDLERSSAGPQFIYSHFIDPHGPYDLAGKRGTPFQRYLREIALVDKQISRLRGYLRKRGLSDRTYLIISADHGEGFGEHGMFNHARTVYEELARVPFFFYLPGRRGQELETPVSGMDIGPTVLDLFGLPTPGFWMGQSLLPVVAGERKSLERPIVLDTGRRMQCMVFDDGYKVIFSRVQRTTEVYDLKRDPLELTNLAEIPSPAVQSALDTAQLFFSTIQLKEAGYETPETKF